MKIIRFCVTKICVSVCLVSFLFHVAPVKAMDSAEDLWLCNVTHCPQLSCPSQSWDTKLEPVLIGVGLTALWGCIRNHCCKTFCDEEVCANMCTPCLRGCCDKLREQRCNTPCGRLELPRTVKDCFSRHVPKWSRLPVTEAEARAAVDQVVGLLPEGGVNSAAQG